MKPSRLRASTLPLWGTIAIAALVVGSILTPVENLQAAPNRYVSIIGEFAFEYPDDWHQIDPRLVDYFLINNKAGRSTLDYEAAFCPNEQDPFWSGPYFFLTVDTSFVTSDASVDSALQSLEGKFGKGIKYFPVADFLADLKSDAPSYDEERKTVSIVNDIVEGGRLIKRHLLVMKFYEAGLATFYFYAPDSVFDQAEEVFNDVLNSFEQGEVDQLLPEEQVEVADIDQKEGSDGAAEEDGGWKTYIPYAVVILLMIIVVGRRFGRGKK